MAVSWIFFDIGSTLVDESAAYDRRAREMLKGKDITFEDFDAKRIEFAKLGFDGNLQAIKFFGLQKTPWHSEDEVPFDDAAEILEYLKRCGYRLGVIANQPPGASERLGNWGLLKYFEIAASSAELGVSKPDKEIFEKALSMAACEPADAVMAGDRLDNDIIPAKSLGMRTVWVRKGLSMYQSHDLSQGKADHIVNNLSELRSIFDRGKRNRQKP